MCRISQISAEFSLRLTRFINILNIFKCLNLSLSSSQIAYLTSGIRPGKTKTFMTEVFMMQLSEMKILWQTGDHQVGSVLLTA